MIAAEPREGPSKLLPTRSRTPNAAPSTLGVEPTTLLHFWLREVFPRARFPSPLEGEGGSRGAIANAIRERGYLRNNFHEANPSPALARLRLRSGTLSLKGRGQTRL